jgi:hypothetical protein
MHLSSETISGGDLFCEKLLSSNEEQKPSSKRDFDQRVSLTDSQSEASTMPASPAITIDAVQVDISSAHDDTPGVHSFNPFHECRPSIRSTSVVHASIPRMSSIHFVDSDSDADSDADCVDARELEAMKAAAMRNRGNQAVQDIDLPGQEFSFSFLEPIGSSSSVELGDPAEP